MAASSRRGVPAWLAHWTGRPFLIALAALNAITGIEAALYLGPLTFGDDADTFRRCALYLAESRTDCNFPYPPLAALVARPLTWVSPTGAAIIMTLIGLAVVVIGVVVETRGLDRVDRALIGVAVLGFEPVVYELLLGQTTLLLAAALYLVARRSDSYRNGVPVGVALALAPKPMLLPVLGWMLIWRRRALGAALLTAAALTLVGLGLTGFDQYREWFLVAAGFANTSFTGNFARGNVALWSHGVNGLDVAIAIVVGGATLWAILRDASRGLVAALLAGLVLAPYTITYAASILLLGIKPALAFAPRATRALAILATPAYLFFITVAPWNIVALAACLPVWRRRGADRRAST